MKLYELAYLLSNSISQEELLAFPKQLTTLIESNEGALEFQSNPVKRALAYPIKKRGKTHTSAYFGHIRFHLDPGKMPDFSESLKSQEQIIRFLISTQKPKLALPTVIAARKKKAVALPQRQKLPKVELEKLEEKLEELLKE